MERKQIRLVIRVILVLVLIAYLFYRNRPHPKKSTVAPQVAGVCGQQCGSERWPVKTLSDAGASTVNFAPQPVSVAWLASQTAPPLPFPQDTRITPMETTTFVVRAKLVGFKLETDQDIHIVLADLTNPSQTMIAEIPSPDCSGVCASAHLAEIQSVRAAFISTFGTPIDRMTPVGKNVQITGVGFFDILHHQTGVAPNGIELHPVLSIQPQ